MANGNKSGAEGGQDYRSSWSHSSVSLSYLALLFLSCSHTHDMHVRETPELSHFIQNYSTATLIELPPPIPCITQTKVKLTLLLQPPGAHICCAAVSPSSLFLLLCVPTHAFMTGALALYMLDLSSIFPLPLPYMCAQDVPERVLITFGSHTCMTIFSLGW